MMEIWERIGLHDKDQRIITNFYWNQTAIIRVEGEHSVEIHTQQAGVCTVAITI